MLRSATKPPPQLELATQEKKWTDLRNIKWNKDKHGHSCNKGTTILFSGEGGGGFTESDRIPSFLSARLKTVRIMWLGMAGGWASTQVSAHNNFNSVYRIFAKFDHIIAMWKGKNPIYFGVITIIPFDNLYRQAYFVMHTFLVLSAKTKSKHLLSWTLAFIPSKKLQAKAKKNKKKQCYFGNFC